MSQTRANMIAMELKQSSSITFAIDKTRKFNIAVNTDFHLEKVAISAALPLEVARPASRSWL